MTSQRVLDKQKRDLEKLIELSNSLFRLELCLSRHLEACGVPLGEVSSALYACRRGELEKLSGLLNALHNTRTVPSKTPCTVRST